MLKKFKAIYMIFALIGVLLLAGCVDSSVPKGQSPGTEQNEKIQNNTATESEEITVDIEEDNTTQVEEDNQKTTEYPLTITDSYDREIVLEKEPVRVVSIAPNITETIFAVGAGEKLVGRTDYCDYPAEVVNIDSIGGLQDPNIEKITELEPDLVIASTHFKKEVLEKLEELGIQVAVLYGKESFEGVYDTIEKVGLILNRQGEASTVINGMKEKVGTVVTKVKDLEQLSVYYVVGFGEYGDYTAGGDTFIGQMLEMAGGRNIARDLEGWQYSLEKIVENDPDLIICSKYYETKAGIQEANGYKDLSAVKEDRLFEIDNNLLDRQGPRLAEGLEELAKIIHPEVFQ